MEVVFGEVGGCDIYTPTRDFITKGCSPKLPSHTRACPLIWPARCGVLQSASASSDKVRIGKLLMFSIVFMELE